MKARFLHTYRCRCGTVAVTSLPRIGVGVRCALCRGKMRYLWSEAITTDEQQALAARGTVYNPGLETKEVA